MTERRCLKRMVSFSSPSPSVPYYPSPVPISLEWSFPCRSLPFMSLPHSLFFLSFFFPRSEDTCFTCPYQTSISAEQSLPLQCTKSETSRVIAIKMEKQNSNHTTLGSLYDFNPSTRPSRARPWPWPSCEDKRRPKQRGYSAKRWRRKIERWLPGGKNTSRPRI